MTPRARTAARACGVTLLVAGVLGLLHALGVGLRILFATAMVFAFVMLVMPWVGVRWFDATVLWVRGRFWAGDQGRFHSFGGVPLQVDDDGRNVWVDGEGLQRALGRREPEPALAARHAGRWRRSPDGTLMLRVDAVVDWLNTMPGRDDPRVQRLRRYFEREVLYPAGQRRQRAGVAAPAPGPRPAPAPAPRPAPGRDAGESS
jgi:hypothetical protein